MDNDLYRIVRDPIVVPVPPGGITAEQHDIVSTFARMLLEPTADGGRKRAAGLKPSWRVDPGHRRAIFSHLGKWVSGEPIDPDSGYHTLRHCAWRCLAVAWQEEHQQQRRNET